MNNDISDVFIGISMVGLKTLQVLWKFSSASWI